MNKIKEPGVFPLQQESISFIVECIGEKFQFLCKRIEQKLLKNLVVHKKIKTSKIFFSAIDGNKNEIERPNKDLKYLE